MERPPVCSRIAMSDTEPTDEQLASELAPTPPTYDYQWRMFVAWCLREEKSVGPPTSPQVVAQFLEHRVATDARPSTLRVVCAAIARRHADMDLPNPCDSAIVQDVMSDIERRAPPSRRRSLPLDLESYRVIRETAFWVRTDGGDRVRVRGRGVARARFDLAMIGLMRDGMLRVREASALTWGAIEPLDNGTGQIRIGGGEDTMYRMLCVIRHRSHDDEPVLGLRPNRIILRIGAAAERAGLGPGYSGESPRLGMLKDLHEHGVVLVGELLEGDKTEGSQE